MSSGTASRRHIFNLQRLRYLKAGIPVSRTGISGMSKTPGMLFSRTYRHISMPLALPGTGTPSASYRVRMSVDRALRDKTELPNMIKIILL